ncbi:sucrase ferredoxin [Ornithinimicrobium pratense]|uniref:Sucrase ferredoxin n=1 Tax=Ornithinimicrobium pratense TaxID=2593973 RepID=A0A5J6V2L4_9MICO|nr:sucrase ferredoxin [Ornithinimicrobium pratense]QFG67965.1 hypothetical protein FY030_03845 [Ornithinimicrobium pratense]
MADTFRCSDAARERMDPMLGTAPPQRRLLLVEQDSGWGSDALASLDVPDDLREEIRASTAGSGTRVMLIRRPGRQRSSVCLMRAWCVVDPFAPAGHRITWGTWSYPTELLAGVERAEELASWARAAGHAAPGQEHDTGPQARALPADTRQPRTGTPPGDDELLLLVCTNGRKDVCCAVRGRPVALSLAQRFPEETWECTHTGGDRFAANVVVLPDGAIYGGLDTDSALETVAAHRQGRPGEVRQHLRGLIGYPRPVQAALLGTQLELGLPWGQTRLGPLVEATARLPESQVEEQGEQLAAAGAEVARWRIDVDVADGRQMVADVTEHLRPAAALTCKAVGRPAHSRVPLFKGVALRA